MPQGEGWFVLSLGEAAWERLPDNGAWCALGAPDASFGQFGIGPHVLMPGEPSAMYHAESDQEGVLVLDGECLAIVEGEERPMRRWDYLQSTLYPVAARHGASVTRETTSAAEAYADRRGPVTPVPAPWPPALVP